MDKFDQLLDMFIAMRDLGDYDRDKRSITLYDIPNNTRSIRILSMSIHSITTKVKIIVPKSNEELINIQILDIDI